MKQLPIGIQSFEQLISKKYLYVDKTEYVHRLITTGAYYFLARPRRFGKSLTVSTLKALFEDKRELFAGLWIDQSTYTWEKHPVVYIDFATVQAGAPAIFKRSLGKKLASIALQYNIVLELDEPGDMLNELMVLLRRQGPVAVLVDEYDAPILKHLPKSVHLHEIHEQMQSFFLTLKGLSEHVQFMFITGVSKFSKTSIFSGFNNLKDISMDERYAELCGYTHTELTTYFTEHIAALATHEACTQKLVTQKITDWYDGYRFAPNATAMYNPFSVLLLCDTKAFKNYWFGTGTPTFLLKMIGKAERIPSSFETVSMSEAAMDAAEPEHLEIVPLMLQTGYLTIKSFDPETTNYTLSFPNREVRSAFAQNLSKYFTPVSLEDYNDPNPKD